MYTKNTSLSIYTLWNYVLEIRISIQCSSYLERKKKVNMIKRNNHNKFLFKHSLQNEETYESIFLPFSKISNKFRRRNFGNKIIQRCCISLISILQTKFIILLSTMFNIIWLYDFVFIDFFHLGMYSSDYYHFHYLPSL